MNTQDREFLRGIADKALASERSKTLEKSADSVYLCVEWRPVVGSGGQLVTLVLGENIAKVSREDYSLNPSWQGVLSCHGSFAKGYIDYLAHLGLWELNDFCPAVELLDGEYFIIRAKDKRNSVFPLEADACLFCPFSAASRNVRKIAKAFKKLIVMRKETIQLHSLLHKYGFAWCYTLMS